MNSNYACCDQGIFLGCDNATHSHLELCPPGEALEAALLPPDNVGHETVNVEAGQVHPEPRPRSLKVNQS